MGYRFVANRFSVRKEIVVDYTVNGKKYELAVRSRLIACPTDITQDACYEKADKIFPNG